MGAPRIVPGLVIPDGADWVVESVERGRDGWVVVALRTQVSPTPAGFCEMADRLALQLTEDEARQIGEAVR